MKIFVDDVERCKEFLAFVIEQFGDKFETELAELAGINLHHRLLETFLIKYQ